MNNFKYKHFIIYHHKTNAYPIKWIKKQFIEFKYFKTFYKDTNILKISHYLEE